MLNDQNAPHPRPSTASQGRPTPLGEPSLADVFGRLSADPDLPPGKRSRWRSCLRRTAQYLGRDMASLPAHMQGLRFGIGRLHAAQLGISEKNLGNLRSDLKAVLRYAGTLGMPSSRQVELDSAWENLYAALDDTRLRRGLSALMRFCTWQKIPPRDVDDAVADRFVEATAECRFTTNPREVRKAVARSWNAAADKVATWPAIRLTVPDHRVPARSLPWDSFSESFRADVAAYLEWLSGRGGYFDEAPDRPCRESTVKLRKRCIRLAASAAVRSGLPLAELTSLADLVQPDTVKRVLEAYLTADGGTPGVFVSNLCSMLTSIAARWCKCPEADIAVLKKFRRRLDRDRTSGLTPKNMEVIRAMQDPANRRRLLGLPDELMAQALEPGMPLYRAAVKAQIAVALHILIHAPMRIGNLVALSLETNVLEPAGPKGPIHLYVPAEDVKNSQPLEYPIPEPVIDMIRLYRREFRDRLRGANSPWLFPGELGEHKSARTMSEQLTKAIHRGTGVRVTPHQLRHIAAAIILEANPGNYELVRRVLGHKNLQTTVNFYIGLETIEAVRQYTDLILKAGSEPREAQP